MKKCLILILSVSIILQCTVIVNAVTYDVDSRYSYDLPEDFYMAEENKFIATDGSNFSASSEANVDLEYCFSDMNDKEVKAFANEITDALNSFSDSFNIKVVSAEKIKHQNGKNAVVIVLEKPGVNDAGAGAIYQKIYMFSGEENVFTFTYATKDKSKLNKLDATFDSIVINEKEAEGTIDKIKDLAFYVVLFAVVLAVVVIFVKRRTK